MRVALALWVVGGHQHPEDPGLSLLQTSALVSHGSRMALQEALVSGESPNAAGAPSPATRLTGSGYHRGHYKGKFGARDERTLQFQEAAWAKAVEEQAAREFQSSGQEDAVEQKSTRHSGSHSASTRNVHTRNATNLTYFKELPANWTAHVDHRTNRTYYYNQDTREVSFEIPQSGNEAQRQMIFIPGMEVMVGRRFTTAMGSEDLLEGTIGTVKLVSPEGDVLFSFGGDEMWLLVSELTNIRAHDTDDIVDVEEREAEEFEEVGADTGESYEDGFQNTSLDSNVINNTYTDEAIQEFGLDPALYAQALRAT